MNKKYCLLTNDVETTSIWLNTLRDDTGWKVFKEGMPILLEIYAKYKIRTTFYFTGYIARLIPDIVKLVIPWGHEIASHGLSHKKEYGFDILSYKNQVKHLAESKKILEDISGQEVISFRAPALRTNKFTAKALIETGYRIDSSIASQRFDMFMSFGGLNKLKWLISPRLPYRTSENSIFQKGDSPLVEVPLSATFFPYVGTTMRIFPKLTGIQKHLIAYESTINGKPVVFDIHPNEFIDESYLSRSIEKRSINPFIYFLQDFLRSKLKVKNLGIAAIPLYEKQINYFLKKEFEFLTIKDYCRKTGLIQ
jgi:peptidoglycan-N-acetylglucosamine deacetylase